MTERLTDFQHGEETQLTQPKKGEPVEIPVPKRGDVLDALEKVAKASDSSGDEGR